MCILSYFPPGISADLDGLTIGGVNNPDGHGWAIVTGGKILMGKSLDLGEALEGFAQARKRHPEGAALFHSRWATHGSVTVANSHPFLVGGDYRTVVAHNGVLPAAAHPASGDDRSDTRVFADELLPTRFRRLDRPTVQDALSRWCGSGNKLVILTADVDRYRRSAYLVNERLGEWDATTGVWHSNSDYREEHYWRSWGAVTGDEFDLFDASRCEVCLVGKVAANGYCGECRSCQDCFAHVRDCQCWERVGAGWGER